jgi:hypothetical protein
MHISKFLFLTHYLRTTFIFKSNKYFHKNIAFTKTTCLQQQDTFKTLT